MKVAIFGPWLETIGFAQHTRQFASALARLMDVSVVPWDAALGRLANRRIVEPDVGIGIGQIEQMVQVAGRYRIGFVVWETTVIPKPKLEILKSLDELWTPSRWGRSILVKNGLAEDRVHVIPEGVDPDLFKPATSARGAHLFRFLCVGKWEARKGIGDLALAYAREFSPSEPVELILHCFNPHIRGFDLTAAIADLDLPSHPPIRASAPLRLLDLVSLYGDCDVLVQPTKAEAWCLPMIEAMSCGIPVIATNYSGHLDFMNNENGYLLNVAQMTEVSDPLFYPGAGPHGLWAQPDLDHLQVLMRRAFEYPAERRAKGHQARRDVLKSWTWRHAAQAAQRRLQALGV